MSSSSTSTTIENQEQQQQPPETMATNVTGWGWVNQEQQQQQQQPQGQDGDLLVPAAPVPLRQRVVITTAGYRDYKMQWFAGDRKNLTKLAKAIRKVHGDGDNGDVGAENRFDILLDASHFQHPMNSRAEHPGSNVEVLERMIAHPEFQPWLHKAIRLYYETDPNQPFIKVLITCPSGKKRSVACAIILQYCLRSLGLEAGTCGYIRHLSKCDIWKEHCRLCKSCRNPERQPRFKQVMDGAADHLFAMMQ